jgi:hypothetical protein
MTSYPRKYNEILQCDDVKYYPSSMTTKRSPLGTVNCTFEISSLNNNGVNRDGIKYDDTVVTAAPREQIVYKVREKAAYIVNKLVSFAILGRIYSKDKPIDSDTLGEDIGNYL